MLPLRGVVICCLAKSPQRTRPPLLPDLATRSKTSSQRNRTASSLAKIRSKLLPETLRPVLRSAPPTLGEQFSRLLSRPMPSRLPPPPSTSPPPPPPPPPT